MSRRQHRCSRVDSPAAKPHEAVAHVGACPLSVGNGQEGNDVSVWEREQGDETTGGGVDVVAAAEKEPSARGKRLGRLSTYDSLANAASTFRHILPKESAVEDTAWRQHAEAIARSLPRRRLRGGLRSSRARKSHDTANSRDEPPRKQIRARIRRQRRRELQAEDLASVLRFLEDEFAVKESLSNEQTWCTPVPHERKVLTVRDFYQAFHDASTLPIRTCMLCYRKRTKKELSDVTWDRWMSSCVEKGDRSPFSCRSCFPVGESILGCAECMRCLRRGGLSPAAQLHGRLGCEHMFPDELKGLTLVEEKLIALNSCYGFVTRHSIPGGQRQSLMYPRHVKGHITVFPNNVQELATKVLPHPLLQVMDEIHVSWQGAEKPGPSDLSSLLSVRRRVVERALVWLKKNNPHYAEIEIDAAEMESWGAPPHGVPSLVYDRMERNEPSAWEKTRTAQVVPPTERAMDDEDSVEIEEILALLSHEADQ
ncbi:hypothetical protein EDB81DRAFT_768727 [Dactylonectria macrodidyma]|uniref:DUF6570 domain-containing protein n=1 Tax=Dactylonectria macrodidyma TaxID=307937 RepID=A0A9P9D205_9HYPO|nr:hypothetical protein EDB81DRAFT_768727 [Dactylonectria macrodidyma]